MPKLNVVKTTKSNIPSKISKLLTDDLTNYLVIKDGYIVVNKLAETFQELVITSEVNNLKIVIPKNFYGNQTLHLFYLFGKQSTSSEIEIVLNENAELTYFEYLYNFEATNVEIVSNSVLFENAKLTYTGITNFNLFAEVKLLRNSYIAAYGNSNYSIAEVSDSLTTVRTNAFLNGKAATATVKTVAITSKDQHADLRQLLVHNAPNTEGYIENYGVANDQSTLSFEGVGKINKKMIKSIARQLNKGIILGNKATLEANPLLLIDEYDVEASHGAAIGKIDQEQLYYLMSRGLTKKEAERLIITGFLSPIIAHLSTQELIKDFTTTVSKKTI